MREIRLSGSMWRGPETERWQPYSGTKPETADTDKGSLHATAPAPDPTADDDLRALAKGRRVAKLLRGPLLGGRARDRNVDDAPGVHVDDEELSMATRN